MADIEDGPRQILLIELIMEPQHSRAAAVVHLCNCVVLGTILHLVLGIGIVS